MHIKRLVLILAFILSPLSLFASSAPDHPVNPEMGMQMLREGNLRFALGQSTHPNTSFSRRLLTTTDGQAPFATVLGCSDSRVPVEILFDQGVGDLFVIKVAGNVADTDEIGSAEYGVGHLGTPVLMVLGHSYCGAVTAVTKGAEVHGSIPQLVDNIIPAVEKARHDHPGVEADVLINMAIEANVWQAIEDIQAKSHAIAERAAAGKVVIVGAIYDILTGKVRILERAGAVAPDAHAAPTAPAETAKTEADHGAPAKTAEPVKETAQTKEAPAAKEAPTQHAEPAKASDADKPANTGEKESSGGFGFFSFIIFVLLLVGAVIVLDKKVLNPEQK